MTHYIVYKTTNTINNKIYIGAHSTTNLDDGYMGSGSSLKLSVKKYGKKNFTTEILHTLDSSEEMYEKEAEIVTKEFIMCESNYNLVTGGRGAEYGHLTSDETRRKIGLSGIGRTPWNKGLSKETNEMVKHQALQMTGKKFTEDHKDKLRKAKLGTTLSETHRERIGKGNKGKVLSEETKEKMSKAKKNQPLLTCIHCNKTTTNRALLNRWHNDNCKNR